MKEIIAVLSAVGYFTLYERGENSMSIPSTVEPQVKGVGKGHIESL